MLKPAYKRILLKLSGESLMGGLSYGIDPEACVRIASLIQQITQLSVQVAIVIGGGNIFRGSKSSAFSYQRSSADQMGMLATMINGISLSQAFERVGLSSRVLSSVSCGSFLEPFNRKSALDYLEKGEVVIFVGGTGNPYFTTDSAAALRALEIEADILFKATKVEGIYDKDPKKFQDAKKYENVSYEDILSLNLQVMDATAIALCRDNKIPIRVFNVFSDENLMKAVCNQSIGTLVERK